MNYAEESLRLHAEWKGKLEVVARVPVSTKEDLSLAYTPGVAQPLSLIHISPPEPPLLSSLRRQSLPPAAPANR